MKSALFIDFDNVYSCLRHFYSEVADKFARNPSIWMNWLIKSLELPDPVSSEDKRRVLVRRCYLNPQAHQRFRPAFSIAGFEIIDCPALTSEGKTSTDIHMVLDIVDLLQCETFYDEFIIFSTDADFTPVLRKLRRADRRTTVLAIGFPSAAYRASADLLIDQDDFVQNALGFGEDDSTVSEGKPAPNPTNHVPNDLRSIQQTVKESPCLVLFPERMSKTDVEELLPKVAEMIKEEIAQSLHPVLCSRLAGKIIDMDNALASDWAGKGTFREFVDALDLGDIVFDWSNSGGVAYDPTRKMALSTGDGKSNDDWTDQSLYRIAKQLHEVANVPLFPPRKFRNLLELIAIDVAESPFCLMETEKRVRDRCLESAYPVSRADVNYVLHSLLIGGHRFDEDPNDAVTLGRKLIDNIRSLCLREQIILDKATDAAIHDWIIGDEQEDRLV
jgi:hypothetical protein